MYLVQALIAWGRWMLGIFFLKLFFFVFEGNVFRNPSLLSLPHFGKDTFLPQSMTWEICRDIQANEVRLSWSTTYIKWFALFDDFPPYYSLTSTYSRRVTSRVNCGDLFNCILNLQLIVCILKPEPTR